MGGGKSTEPNGDVVPIKLVPEIVSYLLSQYSIIAVSLSQYHTNYLRINSLSYAITE